jgi:hypothetical protein
VSDEQLTWFEHAWQVREEEVYPRLFGPHEPKIFVLTADVFVKTFKQASFDPRWLHYGVFEVPPTAERSSWLYVSSGLSNAWNDEVPDASGVSGLGMEFVLQTPGREEWALHRLAHVVAFQILLSCGRYPDRGLLSLHDRIPLRHPVSSEPSQLTWLMIGPPEPFQASLQLPSGSVDLLGVVGVSDAEAAYARANGGAALLDMLRAARAYPVTDWRRESLVEAA